MNIFSNIKGDLFGGISAGVVALPVALAFGAAAGLDPINGLYGAIFLGLIAALIGGTSTLISNPTGPMAVVTAVIVAGQIDKYGGLNDAIPSIIIIFVLAGLLQILFGILKLGRYVAYIPYPVISGFMSGIGFIIIILQFSNFFGIHEKYSVLETLRNLGYIFTSANWVNVGLAASTVLIIYLFPIINKKIGIPIPSTLVALVGVSSFSYLMGFDVKTIGNIPSDLPEFKIGVFAAFNYGEIFELIPLSLSLAGLGMIDSLLTSVVADNLTKTRHNSNKELIGQGIGNMVAGLFGGIPGAGTTPATVLNINSGGRTKLSGIIHALILILILLVGGPVAAKIPFAVLSGILVTVGVSVLDHNVIKDIKYVPKNDNIIMLIVLVCTVFWDLLFAVAIGLIIAALYFMKRMADIVEQETSHERTDVIIEKMISTFDDPVEFREKVSIMSLNGPMFFGFASRFQEKIDALPDTVKAVVFDFSNVLYLDQSGAYTLRDAIKILKEKGINTIFSDAHDFKLEMFEGIKVIPDLVDQDHIFGNVEEAVHWLDQPGHIDNIFDQDEELYIPSDFSPDGDGINDFWEIRNIDKYPNCNVIVYTKTNILIFEAKGGYNEPWDGTNLRNKEMPIGKYVYEVDLHGDGKDVRIGTVSIFR